MRRRLDQLVGHREEELAEQNVAVAEAIRQDRPA